MKKIFRESADIRRENLSLGLIVFFLYFFFALILMALMYMADMTQQFPVIATYTNSAELHALGLLQAEMILMRLI